VASRSINGKASGSESVAGNLINIRTKKHFQATTTRFYVADAAGRCVDNAGRATSER
jgi:hypothetical protein